MKRERHPSTLCAAACVLAAAFAAVRAAPPNGPVPELWKKAVAIFEANKMLVPGSMTQTMEKLDGDGNAESRTESRLLFSLGDAEEKVKTEIVLVVKDGKDITEEQKKEAAERREKRRAKERKDAKEGGKERSHSFSSSDSPFNPDVQIGIVVVETGDRGTVAGRDCIAFAFAYETRDRNDPKAKPHTVKGMAWLEEGTGYPLKVESTRDPLPRGVKRMSSTFLYEVRPDGSWVLGEMLFEGRGGFLFINKSFRMKAVFADYWLYPQAEAD